MQTIYGNHTGLNPKVKVLLQRIDGLCRHKLLAVAVGLPTAALDVEITTLINAVKMIEGNGNG